jgi:hypothetical protein
VGGRGGGGGRERGVTRGTTACASAGKAKGKRGHVCQRAKAGGGEAGVGREVETKEGRLRALFATIARP